MTRETKIGLLVGLAFIIVIGILLSDHINNSTQPLQAAMNETPNAIESSVATPNQRNDGKMTVVTPGPIIPQNPVSTQRQPLAPPSNGSTIVEVSPGGDPSQLRLSPRPAQQDNNQGVVVLGPAGNSPPDNGTSDNTPAGPVVENQNPNSANPMQRLVDQHKDDLVTIGNNKPPVGISGTPGPTPSGGTPIAGRQIKAEEGDTVTKLALKYMGANTRANRDAIIKANPSMTPDGHLVISGRTYIIPGAAPATPTIATANPPATPAPQPVQKPAPAPTPAPAANLYTVKENDSLWKIASEQLGSGARYTEIRDLNPDVLKGSDNVHIGMRLKLPPKTVASTN